MIDLNKNVFVFRCVSGDRKHVASGFNRAEAIILMNHAKTAERANGIHEMTGKFPVSVDEYPVLINQFPASCKTGNLLQYFAL
jgi:hypothetical protein